MYNKIKAKEFNAMEIDKNEYRQLVRQYYSCSDKKAEQIISLASQIGEEHELKNNVIMYNILINSK